MIPNIKIIIIGIVLVILIILSIIIIPKVLSKNSTSPSPSPSSPTPSPTPSSPTPTPTPYSPTPTPYSPTPTPSCQGQTIGDCCPGNTWDCDKKACVNPNSPTPAVCHGLNSTLNKDKTKCISTCRIDGLLAGDQCQDIDDKGNAGDTGSTYFDAVDGTTLGLNGRTVCFRKTPAHDDVTKLCYHGEGRHCHSSSEGDVTGSDQARKNINALGYYVTASDCYSFENHRDDCFVPAKYDGNANSYLSDPNYPAYVYLNDDPKYFAKSEDDRIKAGDGTPVNCWGIEPKPYSQYGTAHLGPRDGYAYLYHTFPDRTSASFCDGALASIAPFPS